MTILDKLISDIRLRQSVLRADRNIYTHCLKELDPDSLIQNSYGHILRGLERKSSLVEIAASIGRRIRQKLRLTPDSIADVQVGWFVCISYIECGILEYRLKHTYKKGKKSKHQAYQFAIKDWNAIKHLWTLIDKTKVDLFPLKEQAADWVGAIHTTTGFPIIKKGHPDALRQINRDDHVILMEALNRLQGVGWAINRDVFAVYQQALRVELDTQSPFKFHKEIDEQKRKSLLIEVEAIEQAALSNLNNTFYHVYNCDFR